MSNETNGFTVKEMLLTISNKLDRFIESDRIEKKDIDERIDHLEQHRASIISNFRLAAWIFGAVGGAGSIYGIIKLLG